MRTILMICLSALLVGCLTPRAERFYAACVEAIPGNFDLEAFRESQEWSEWSDEDRAKVTWLYFVKQEQIRQETAKCRIQTEEVDSRAWQGLGQGLQSGAAAYHQYAPRPPRTTITNCQVLGTYVHCTSY